MKLQSSKSALIASAARGIRLDFIRTYVGEVARKIFDTFLAIKVSGALFTLRAVARQIIDRGQGER